LTLRSIVLLLGLTVALSSSTKVEAQSTSPTPSSRGGNQAGKPRDLSLVPAINEEGKPDRWAVVVGINHYKAPGIDLHYSAGDARLFAQTLETSCGFRHDHIKLLIDDQATSMNVRTSIGTWLAKVAGRRDLVVIYYSGHGAPDLDPNVAEDGIRKYIVTQDADPDNLFATAVPMDEFSSALLRIRSEQTVVLLDCCYSGAAGSAGNGLVRTLSRAGEDVSSRIKSGFLDSLALSGRGRAVITGCDAAERTWEYEDLGHGIFTYYLVKGLQGQAADPVSGKVGVRSLYDFVYRNIHDGHNGRAVQTPLLVTSVAGELELAGKGLTTDKSDGAGEVKIVTSPLGASIFVDRETKPLSSPADTRLAEGMHHISIYKPGYLPTSDDIFVSSSRPLVNSYVLNVEETNGDLLIVATPNAAVNMDGQAVGVVPSNNLLRLADVSQGTHTVRVEATGFKVYEKPVDVEAGRPNILRVPLEKAISGLREATAANVPAGLTSDGKRFVWTKDAGEMVFVSPGSFQMGTDTADNAHPKHEVSLGGYWIDKCEVTNRQYSRFVDDSGYRVQGAWTPADQDKLNRPATRLTLADAKAYAAWAGKKLPTEEQWEKAARGPDGRLYPYGTAMDLRSQNIRSYGFHDALDVGSLAQGASPYGALNMLGNVWEWCDTVFAAYPGNSDPISGSGGSNEVIRGGSYLSPALAADITVATRAFLLPNLSQEDVGFRCIAPAPN